MERDRATRCIHLDDHGEARNGKDNGPDRSGAVSFPIYQSATFVHMGVGRSTGYDYSRTQNPTRERLEQFMTQLEYGVDAFALSTGMAAITLLMELFSPGDHIIVDNDLYGGSIRLFEHVNLKNGLTFTSLDCGTDDIEAAIRENTKAIFLETPTNPMMHVSSIRSISSLAHDHGILLIVDNTFLSPYFMNPLLLGADIVVHSGTKFLCGHNDTLAGFLVVNSDVLSERLRYLMKTTGACLAPFDCWLLLRGMKTLAIRMEKAQENAMRIAEWMRTQPIVEKVLYPGLPDHPGYEIMCEEARGFGSMLTFSLKTKKQALTVLESVRLVQFAESLGGVETLITYPLTQTHADVPREQREKNGITEKVLRLSTGIEDAGDLIRDLEQAFAAAAAEE